MSIYYTFMSPFSKLFFFFFNDTATTEIYTLSLHDALPIYVRTNRPRFWAPDRAADEAALRTLYDVLLTVARLLAPAAPFVSDWLHRALVGTSVHLVSFPSDQGRREPELLGAMGAIRKLASLARAARETKQLHVRQPVARLQVAVPAAVKGRAL